MAAVTHVIPVFKPGGAELQLAALATAQAKGGTHTSVWCLTADPLLTGEVESSGVHVASLRQNPVRFAKQAWRGWRLDDVVHSWMYHGFLMGAALRPFGRATHIWGVRRTEPFSPGLKRRTRAVVRLCRALAPHAADGLVFCSRTAMERHVEAGFDAPHLAVTLNAIPKKYTEAPPAADTEVFTVGCLTRWTFDKGIDVLLRAWADYHSKGNGGELHLAGPGINSDNAELVAMVAENGVADSVRLLGPFRDPREFHRSLDVYVSPSRTEGFPNVVAEAMATARPVVATDVGGTAEVLGDTGTLVSNEDHAAITAALADLSVSPEIRQATGAAERERCITEFTVEATERSVREAYRVAGAAV